MFHILQNRKKGRNNITNITDQKKRQQNQGQSMRRRPWSVWKVRKRRYSIPKICNWKYFYYSSHWYTWETWSGNYRYTRGIHTCKFRRSYHHGIKETYLSIDFSHKSKNIQEVHYIRQEWKTRSVSKTDKGPLRTSTKCTLILPKVIGNYFWIISWGDWILSNIF